MPALVQIRRRCGLHQEWVLAIGGFDGGTEDLGTTTLLELHNGTESPRIWPGPSLDRGRSGFGCCWLDGAVWIVGGRHGDCGTAQSSVVKYEFSRNEWLPMPSLIRARESLVCCGCGGAIWAIGGSAGGKRLNSVEVFHPSRMRWSEAKSLRVARAGHGAVMFQGRLLVVGGMINAATGNVATASMECVEPAVQPHPVHSHQAQLNTPRAFFGIAKCPRAIVVAGGLTDTSFLSATDTVEVYNGHTWVMMQPLHSARAGCTLSAFADGMVVVLGGVQ